ncbi:MAG: TIGR04255 family protein [Acidobacteria bacterium]|nr:TIGR04255 family protein [Acidobacteriota bacterium]MBU4308122.1 TIGR04255 family protein [Acidobacteriota bacterium]MCG2812555.1 TIGR04255 family protein [Candidatus Aminicenantes bacterium]
MKTLPSYKKPPVDEVVCGIRFKVPDKLRITHFGLLWDKFKKEYPNVQHAIPIATNIAQVIEDKSTGMPLPRVWFINKSDDQVIQFQIDRLYFNWRHRNDAYPRYLSVIDNFSKTYEEVDKFFTEMNFGNIEPIESELSYINIIEKGKGWNSLDDLPHLFTDFGWALKKTRFLPNPKNISWKTAFELPENQGRLTIKLDQVLHKETKEPLLRLELAACGSSDSFSKDGMLKWFDLAHRWIVEGFSDITSKEIQKNIWERDDV